MIGNNSCADNSLLGWEKRVEHVKRASNLALRRFTDDVVRACDRRPKLAEIMGSVGDVPRSTASTHDPGRELFQLDPLRASRKFRDGSQATNLG